jgi:hypothetical protein
VPVTSVAFWAVVASALTSVAAHAVPAVPVERSTVSVGSSSAVWKAVVAVAAISSIVMPVLVVLRP